MSFLPQATGESSQPDELRVLTLGPLRQLLKMDEFCVPFPPDGSQAAFWEILFKRFPGLRPNQAAIRLARHHQFLLPEEKLKPGDEIALIPPVSGG